MKKILLLLTAALALSCVQNSGTTQVSPVSEPATAPVENSVQETVPAVSSTLSKGTIESVQDIEVYCQMQEQVMSLNIKEGQKVRKGQTLLVLNEENLMNELVQARNEFEQASSSYEEILVGLGYSLDNINAVPEYTSKMAKVKSGYNIKEASLQQAERNYAKRYVQAPIAGTVTDVKVHQYDLPQADTPICRIFDAEHMKVVFNILESERERIEIGKKVTVMTIAYSNEIHTASVSQIASRVSSNGMIAIEAELDDANNLMPGMTALVDLLR